MILKLFTHGKNTLLAVFFMMLPFILVAQSPADVAQSYGATPITEFNGHVLTIAAQSDGKIILGGNFNEYNGYAENYIIRLNADGTKDTSFTTGTGFSSSNTSSEVRAIAIQSDGKIVVGGGFANYNGLPQNKIIRLNPDGTKDYSFNVGAGFNGLVTSIKIQPNGKILVGGGFTSYNGVVESNLVRLNADGSKDSTFNTGGGFNNIVWTFALQPDGKIVVGGFFTTYRGLTENRIIRLNSNGTKDISFNTGTGFTESVRTIAIQADGKIVVGGEFSHYKDLLENSIIRLNVNGSKDVSFNIGTGTPFSIDTIAIQSDGKIIAGGIFGAFNNIEAERIVRLNVNGAVDTTFNIASGFDYQVTSLFIQSDGKIIVGGAFNSYQGIPAHGIIRLNADASKDLSFDNGYVGTGFNAVVRAVAIQPNQKIIAAGDFSVYNNATEKRIIRLNIDGTKDDSFNTGTGFDGAVNAMVLQPDGKIIIGGDFTIYKGVTQRRLIRLNPDGSKDTSFMTGDGIQAPIYAMALQPDGKIIIGGDFASYNGSCSKIVRLNNDGTRDTSFLMGTGFNERVTAISLQSDGKILVGGYFTNYKWLSQFRLIRLNSDGSKDASFEIGAGFNANPNSIAVQQDGKILVGGRYNSFNGVLQNYMIRLNNNGSKDDTFNIGAGFDLSVVSVVVKPDGKILVGGYFKAYQGTSENRIISLNPDGSKDSSFDAGSGFGNYVATLSMHPDGKITVGGGFNFYKSSIASARLITLYGDSLLSTAEVEGTANFSLWPNPVQNILHIRNLDTSGSLKIYNLQGKLVYENTDLAESIDVSSFASGLYVVHLQTEKGRLVKKFIKS